METAQERWHVVQVKAKHEIWAAQNLRHNGHEVYLPMRRLTETAGVGFVQRKGAVKARVEGGRIRSLPLFPGYLFVLVRSATEWASIFTTMGVTSVVGTRERPQAVRKGVVEKLKEAEELGLMAMASVEEINDRLAGVEAGDPVKLLMMGEEMAAVFGTNIDAERCMVLVSICGRDSRTYVPKALVSR